MVEILVPITLFICIAAGIIITTFINRTASHKERMALIENGLDASIFDEKSRKKKRKKDENKEHSLKWGMVAVSVGMGFIVGSVLDSILGWGDVAYFAMIMVFGGAALIAYYFLMDKKEKEEKRDNDTMV